MALSRWGKEPAAQLWSSGQAPRLGQARSWRAVTDLRSRCLRKRNPAQSQVRVLQDGHPRRGSELGQSRQLHQGMHGPRVSMSRCTQQRRGRRDDLPARQRPSPFRLRGLTERSGCSSEISSLTAPIRYEVRPGRRPATGRCDAGPQQVRGHDDEERRGAGEPEDDQSGAAVTQVHEHERSGSGWMSRAH